MLYGVRSLQLIILEHCLQVTLDMIEMVFAKADPRVSLLYEEHLCAKELHAFGDTVRQ